MLTYAIILLAAGIALAFLEAILPSGGILAVLAIFAIVGSLIFAFQESVNTGLLFIGLVVFILPATAVLGLKLWPHTPIGKRMILKAIRTPAPGQTLPDPRGADTYAKLLHRTGTTVTPLRPAGTIEIDQERYSAVAEGEFIDAKTPIEVVRLDGNSIVVDQKTPGKPQVS